MKTHTVYILYSKKTGKFYVGQTNDFIARFERHNKGQNLSTKSGVPWIKIYTEEYSTRSEATKREMFIKKRGAKRFLEDIKVKFFV